MEEVISAYQVICSKLKKYTEIYKFVQVFNSDVRHLFERKMFCGHVYSRTRKDQNSVLIKTDELGLCLQHIFMEACVPGTVLGSQDTVVNEIDSVLALREFMC